MQVPLERPRIRLVEMGEALRAELARSLASAGFETASAEAAGNPSSRDLLLAHALHVIDLAAPGATDWLGDSEARRRSIFLARTAGDLRGAGAPSGPCSDLDVLVKPFSVRELETRIQHRLGRLDRAWLARVDPLLETLEPQLARVFDRALVAARGSGPICIEGELGTGRRALARAIHLASPRAAGACVEIDSSVTFDVVGEARTVPVARAVEGAQGGVLLVVEPTDWSRQAQQALLRALDGCEGDAEPRCIAIVRGRLERALVEGRLETALAYRLAGTHLRLPPLRERELDQASIGRALARRIARELGRTELVVDESLLRALSRDGFPGNRFGIESRLRSALVDDVGAAIAHVVAADAGTDELPKERIPALELRTLERDAIVRALARSKGNRTHAARSLGISVRTLRNKLHVYGLR